MTPGPWIAGGLVAIGLYVLAAGAFRRAGVRARA
jgi:hypothetical protein